jgi:Xaa-Pro aminopeptidase
MRPVRELEGKRDRVAALLERRDLDALVLRRPGNVAWFSGGGRTHILATPETGVAALVVTRGGCEVVTAVNEAPRLRTEELHRLDALPRAAEWRVLPWDVPLDSALPAGPRVGCDGSLRDAVDVSGEVEALRRALLPEEVDRYRALGRLAAEALTDAALALSPSDTEHAAAARVSAALTERGLDPVVLLVAGESRVFEHRHPLPTAAPLGRLVMLVACARAGGLVASLTRFVSFGLLPDGYDRLLAVEAAFLDATVPGARVGDVYAAGAAAYADNGFPSDEATRHHQGGPAGYESRDHLATAACDEAVEPWQAFAWNPSSPGAKVEDTVLAAAAGSVEVLTVDPRWPTETVAGRARPRVLER